MTDVTTIRKALADGPLIGGELVRATRLTPFEAWRRCQEMADVTTVPIGRRYLRIDRSLPSLARLSPSIGREFWSFTVAHLSGQEEAAAERCAALTEMARSTSSDKRKLARWLAQKVLTEALQQGCALERGLCFLLAGDIVYGMAHAEPRPEISTDFLVKGSDLDVVIVHEDAVEASDLRTLDGLLLAAKYRMLTQPSYREELDYVIKPFSRVEQQAADDGFESAVAIKILCESEFLAGDMSLAASVSSLLDHTGARARVEELTGLAISERARGEALLATWTEPIERCPAYVLWATSEEQNEVY